MADHPILILTRPERSARRFLNDLDLGPNVRVILSPLFRIEAAAVPIARLDGYDLIVTSENALNALADYSLTKDATIYCVGPRTAERAKAFSGNVVTGPGDAEALAGLIAQHASRRPLLYLRGAEISFDLAAHLSSAGVPVEEVVAYHQRPLSLTDEAKEALVTRTRTVMPLFSARSAVIAQTDASGWNNTCLVAISSKVAALIDPSLGSVVVSPRPDGIGMRQAVETALTKDLS